MQAVVKSVLNNVIGRFCEFEGDINLSMWSGKAVLRHVRLKPGCLADMGLPLDISAGFIDRIELVADWRGGFNKPVEVDLHHVYLVATPRSDFSGLNSRKMRADAISALEASKMEQLQTWEDQQFCSGNGYVGKNGRILKAQSSVEESDDQEGKKASMSWTEKVMAKVMNNLKLRLNTLHLRVEMGHSVALGINLDGLNLESTDGEWKAKFFEEVPDVLFKSLSLDNFFLYVSVGGVWSEMVRVPLDEGEAPPNEPQFRHQLQCEIDRERQPNYVLEPLSLHVKVTMNQVPDVSPRTNVDLALDHIKFSFSQAQYHGLLALLETISVASRRLADLIGDDIYVERTSDLVNVDEEYVHLYNQTLYVPSIRFSDPSSSDTSKKMELECSHTYKEIVFYRSTSLSLLDEKLAKSGKTYEIMRKKDRQSTGMLSSFTSWFQGKPGDPDAEQQAAEFNVSDFVTVEEAADDGAEELSKTFVTLRVGLRLPEISLSLTMDGAPLTRVAVLSTSVDVTMFVASMDVKLCIADFQIANSAINTSSEPGQDSAHAFPNILLRPTALRENLLELLYRQNPIDINADMQVVLHTSELDIVVEKYYLQRLMQYMQAPTGIDLTAVSKAKEAAALAAQNQYKSAQANAPSVKEVAMQAEATRSSVVLDISIEAPTVIIPLEPLDPNSGVLVVDLGQFSVNSSASSAPESGVFEPSMVNVPALIDGDPQSPELARCYDQFELVGSNMAIFLIDGGKDWRARRQQQLEGDAEALPVWAANLLQPVDLCLLLGISLYGSCATLPLVLVSLRLPKLRLRLSPPLLQQLVALAESLADITGQQDAAHQVPVVQQKPARVRDRETQEEEEEVEAEARLVVQDMRLADERKIHLFLSLRLDDIELALGREEPRTDVVLLSISGIGVQMRERSFDRELNLRLRRVRLCDEERALAFLDTSHADTDADLSTTESVFVTVSYFAVQRTSPSYLGVDQMLGVIVGTLRITLEPEAIYQTARFLLLELAPAAEPSEEAKKKTAVAPIVIVDDVEEMGSDTTLTISQVAQAKNAARKLKQLTTDDIEIDTDDADAKLDEEAISSAASEAEVFVSMKMNAEFGGLDLDVLAGDSGLLNACLKDLVLSFRQCTDDSISLTSCLASFFVRDLMLPAEHPHALVVSAGHPSSQGASEQEDHHSLIDLEVQMHNKNAADFDGVPIDIKCHLDGICCIIRLAFIGEVSDFAEFSPIARLSELTPAVENIEAELIDDQPIDDQPHEKQDGARGTTASASSGPLIPRLEVVLGNVEILFPCEHSLPNIADDSTLDALVASLGRVSVLTEQSPQSDGKHTTVARLDSLYAGFRNDRREVSNKFIDFEFLEARISELKSFSKQTNADGIAPQVVSRSGSELSSVLSTESESVCSVLIRSSPLRLEAAEPQYRQLFALVNNNLSARSTFVRALYSIEEAEPASQISLSTSRYLPEIRFLIEGIEVDLLKDHCGLLELAELESLQLRFQLSGSLWLGLRAARAASAERLELLLNIKLHAEREANDELDAEVAITQFRIDRIRSNGVERSSVLRPFTLSMCLQQYRSRLLATGGMCSNVVLRMDSLHLFITYSVIRLISDSAAALSKAFAPFMASEPASEQSPAQELDQKTNDAMVQVESIDLIEGSLDEVDEILEGEEGVSQAKPKKQTRSEPRWQLHERVEVTFDELRIEMVNDCLGRDRSVPLLSIRLQNSGIGVIGYGVKRTARAGAGLDISYYNTTISEWEPMLELVEIELCFDQTEALTEMSASCLKGIELNLTQGMLESILLSQKLIEAVSMGIESDTKEQDKEQDSTADISLPSVPKVIGGYRLYNSTEVEMSVSETTSSISLTLPPYTSSMLELPASVSESSSAALVISLSRWKSLDPIPLSKSVGADVQWLQRANADTDSTAAAAVRIVVEVSNVGAISTIDIHSCLGLCNLTPAPLFVSDLKLEPGDTFWSPIDPLEMQPVTISASERHQPSKEIDMMSEFDKEVMSLLGSAPPPRRKETQHEQNLRISRTSLQLEKLKDLKQRKKDMKQKEEREPTPHAKFTKDVFYTLSSAEEESVSLVQVQAPFLVENLLLHDVTVRVFNSTSEVESVSLFRGESRALFYTSRNKLAFSLTIPELEASSGSTPTEIDLQKGALFTLEDPAGESLEVRVEVVGCSRVSIYCTHWLYDLSGVKEALRLSPDMKKYCLGHRQHWAIQQQIIEEDLDDNPYNDARMPVMYSALDGSQAAITSAFLCLNTKKSEWSSLIAIDAAGSSSVVGVLADDGKRNYQFIVSIALAPAPFTRTKIITIAPRFALFNHLQHTLSVRQGQSIDAEIFHIAPGGRKLLLDWPSSGDDVYELRVRRKDAGGESPARLDWSRPIDIGNVGIAAVTLRSNGVISQLVKVDVQSSSSSMFVVFSVQEASFAPVRVENRCLIDHIWFRQQGLEYWSHIAPAEALPFAWDDCISKHKIISLQLGSKVSERFKTDNLIVQHIDVDKLSQFKEVLDESEESKEAFVPQVRGERRLRKELKVELHEPERCLRIYVKNRGPSKTIVIEEAQPLNPNLIKDRRAVVLKQIGSLVEQWSARKLEARSSGGTESSGGILLVDVVEASGLSGVNFTGSSRPYCIISYNGTERHSQLVEDTVDPYFAFQSMFVVDDPQQLDVLKVSVFNRNRLLKDDFLGGIVIPLNKLRGGGDLPPIQRWFPLLATRENPANVENARIHLNIRFLNDRAQVLEDEANTINAQLLMQQNLLRKLETTLRKAIQEKKDKRDSYTAESGGRISIVRPDQEQQFDVEVALVDFDCAAIDIHRPSIASRRSSLLLSGVEPTAADSLRSETSVISASQRTMPSVSYTLQASSTSLPQQQKHQQHPTSRNRVVCVIHADVPGEAEGSECMMAVTSVDGVLCLDEWKDGFRFQVPKSSLSDASPSELVLSFYEEVLTSTSSKLHYNQLGSLKVGLDSDISAEDDFIQGEFVSAKLRLRRTKAAEASSVSIAKTEFYLSHLGISVVDKTPAELLYISLDSVECSIETSKRDIATAFVLDRFQIDNQSREGLFPVILAAKPVDDSVKQPLLQISANMLNLPEQAGYTHVQYASILLQELDIRLEEELVWSMLEFVNGLSSSPSAGAIQHEDRGESSVSDAEHWQRSLDDTLLTASPTSISNLFLLEFCLHPIALNLSFEADLTRREESRSHSLLFNPFEVVLGALGSAFGSISSAPVRLTSLTLKEAFGPSSALLDPIMQHYTSQALRQVLGIVLSASAFGNPVALVGSIGTGVKQLFYEPAQGFVSSPKDFGKGLVSGSSKFMRHTVGGVLDSAGQVTDTLGKGVAALAMDASFLAQREEDQRRRIQAAARGHETHGISSGFKALGKGLSSGVKGLFRKPMQGASSGGVVGLAKGVGKGVVGLIAKPAVGIIDLGTHTLQGLRDQAGMPTGNAIERARLPRCLHTHCLERFDKRDAEAQYVLWFAATKSHLPHSLAAQERLVSCVPLGEHRLLALSTFRIVLVDRNELARRSDVSVRLHNIQEIQAESLSDGAGGGDCINISLLNGDSKSIPMPSGASNVGSVVRALTQHVSRQRPRLLSAKYGCGLQWLDVLEVLQQRLGESPNGLELKSGAVHALVERSARNAGSHLPSARNAQLHIDYRRGENLIHVALDPHKHGVVL